MKRKEAMAFIARNHWAVMSTFFPRGTPQLTPVVYALMGDKIRISCTRYRKKTKNLLRNPHAVLCIITPKFFGDYLTVEGRVSVVEDPDATQNAALYEAINGKPPDDLEEYLAERIRDQRLILEMTIERLYPLE
ncbi:MAG: PPOX class F420-dependent oxidoreductase [Nitrospinota bacterium]